MLTRAKKVDRAVSKLPSIPKDLVSLFLTGPMTGEAINEAGAAFKKALIEASLNAELSHHLGYEPGPSPMHCVCIPRLRQNPQKPLANHPPQDSAPLHDPRRLP